MGKNFAIQTWLLAAQANGSVEFWETACVWSIKEMNYEISMTDDGDFMMEKVEKGAKKQRVEKLSDILKIYE